MPAPSGHVCKRLLFSVLITFPELFLFAAMTFQQYGISVYPQGVAASGRSGFITATYVVMVSVVSVFMGKKMHWIIGVSVTGCVAGMYLLCMSGGVSGIYLGDVLVFLGAICFTKHILVIDKFSSTDSMKMSCIQFIVIAIISTFAMIFKENVHLQELKQRLTIHLHKVLEQALL